MTLDTKEHLHGKWIIVQPILLSGCLGNLTTMTIGITALPWGLKMITSVCGMITSVMCRVITSARNQSTVCVTLTLTKNKICFSDGYWSSIPYMATQGFISLAIYVYILCLVVSCKFKLDSKQRQTFFLLLLKCVFLSLYYCLLFYRRTQLTLEIMKSFDQNFMAS